MRRSLSALKKILGPSQLIIEADIVSLDHAMLTADVTEFRHVLMVAAEQPKDDVEARLQMLRTATNLYRGDFMAGFTLPDSPGFDEWQFFQCESLRRELIEALKQLIQLHITRSDYEEAIVCARDQLKADPYDEDGHRALICWRD